MSASPLQDTVGKRLGAYLTTPQDFRKHRQRLAREILHLRRELNIVTKDTKNYQEKEQTSSIDAAKYEVNAKYGQVLLLLAERSAVHALEIKSMLELKGQKIPGFRKLMLGKLKLAVNKGKQLATVVAGEADSLKKIELFVFCALVHGQYALNKKQWSETRYAFAIARVALEFLAANVLQDQGSSSLGKSTIEEILDSLVDPALALAHLQDFSGGKATADLRTVARKHCRDNTVPYLADGVELVASLDSTFVEEIAEEHVAKTVEWRSHEATIYNDELALKLSQLSREDWKLYTDANDYDGLYSRWSVLVDIHQADVDKNVDEDDMQKTQDNAVLLTYLKYHMLFVKVKRDLLLIQQLHAHKAASTAKALISHKDVLRLYASVTATTDELKDLPGVYNDEDLYESLEALSRLFTTARSAIVADAYAAANKLPEALSIYLHIQRTFPTDASFFKVDAFPYEVSSNDQVAEFRQTVATKMAKVHTLAQLKRESEGVTPSLVTDNVYKFPSSIDSLHNITNITEKGAILPVLSKPVLFDVAFNYIGYSVEGQKTLQKSTSSKVESESDSGDKKKGGFFGIFGRG